MDQSSGVSVHSRLCYGEGPRHSNQAPQFNRDYFGGSETFRRTNKKPTRLTLTRFVLTTMSGIKDGTNGTETVWVAKVGLGRQGGTQRLGPPEVSALAKASPRYASCGFARFGHSYTAYLPPSKSRTWLTESPDRATAMVCTASPSTPSRSCRFSGPRGSSRSCPTGNSTV